MMMTTSYRLSDFAPNFRCSTYGTGNTYVEIPSRYLRQKIMGAPSGRLD